MPGCSRIRALVLTIVLPFSSYAQTVQKAGLQLPDSAAASRDQATQLFTTAFNAYSQFAFGHDDLTRTYFVIKYGIRILNLYFQRYQRFVRWLE